ncbi:NOP9 protein, partial [Centropus unirufus]|nr:NOP9 protein [Centropus unirufus]
ALQSPVPASLCLQGALRVLGHCRPEVCARLCQRLLPGPGALLPGLQDPERSRVLEAALAVAAPPELRRIFQELRGQLRGLARHRVGNHGLQRLLERAPGDLVAEALSELGPALSEPLAQGHPGVVTALMAACARCPELQEEALRHLLQVGHAPS